MVWDTKGNCLQRRQFTFYFVILEEGRINEQER